MKQLVRPFKWLGSKNLNPWFVMFGVLWMIIRINQHEWLLAAVWALYATIMAASWRMTYRSKMRRLEFMHQHAINMMALQKRLDRSLSVINTQIKHQP